MDLLTTIAALMALIGLGLLAAWLLRGYLSDGAGSTGLFGGGRERRLGVIETASVDGRRKLVLIQRDGVEHLIMTGGPIDVVIETGIEPRTSAEPGFEQRATAPRPEDGHHRSAFDRMREAAGIRTGT